MLKLAASTIGEDSGTIEEVYEPYLVQNGLVLRKFQREGGIRFSIQAS